MEAVKGGMLGINAASRSYGVSRTTLRGRIPGRIIQGQNLVPYLSDKEKITFLKQASATGYGETKKETIATVQQTSGKKKLCDENFNGEGW